MLLYYLVILSSLAHILQGKTWISNVRKCLLTKLVQSVKSVRHQSKSSKASCDMIEKEAFVSHIDCYMKKDDGPNFCDIVEDGNLIALWKVFEILDLFESLARQQVIGNCG